MLSSSSDSDSETDSPLTDCLADKLLSMNPQYEQRTPNINSQLEQRHKSRKTISNLKSVLDKQNKGSSPKRSNRIDSKKKIEDCLKDLQCDFERLANKFQSLHELLPSLLESMDAMETRVTAVEDQISEIYSQQILPLSSNSSHPTPFRDALISNDSQRIDKLEYISSEEERKKRSLEVSVTDPSINIGSNNLSQQIEKLFTDKLKMERREIDSRLLVRKAKRTNTAIVSFSDQRFKKFAFRARKKIREENESPTDLFLNDNLTPYNHKILMELKKRRKTFNDDTDPFISIYSFDGRVFIKMKNSTNPESKNIKNMEQMKNLLDGLGGETSVAATRPSIGS